MRFILLVSFLLVVRSALAQEIITIESTITGSQEQPKVISIVPWQKPADPNYFGEDITNIGSASGPSVDVFKSIDRNSFEREREYISSMKRKDSNKK